MLTQLQDIIIQSASEKKRKMKGENMVKEREIKALYVAYAICKLDAR